MNYPLKSFLSAFFIWFLMLFLLSESFLITEEVPQVSLQIDSSALPYTSHQDHDLAVKGNVSKDLKHDLTNSKSEKNLASQKVSAIYNPLPAIPEELRGEAFTVNIVARFHISAAGEVEEVELVKPCANWQLNRLLLKSLKEWKFSAGNSFSTQDISVNFEVK